jgi:XRE family transcriptional regulator, fatty acid utilization regulator
MARKVMLGSRLRRLRTERGHSQTELARRLGISVSYLNLIEHNRRNLTVPLLLRLSQLLDLDPKVFSPPQEEHQIAELTDALKDSAFEELDLSETDIRELAGAAPQLTNALLKAYDAYRTASNELQVLSERFADGAMLAGAPYRLRTLLTSILSFSEILYDNAEMDTAERRRFLSILVDESRSLSETVTAILGSTALGGLSRTAEHVMPDEAVSDFIQAHGNHFAELERVAETLRAAAGLDGTDRTRRLVEHLSARLGVSVVQVDPGAIGALPARYEADSRRLLLSAALPTASVNFRIAALIAQLANEEDLRRLATGPELPSDAARDLAVTVLANYVAGASLMPYAAFRDTAEATRHDIERMQHRFGASFEQVCHRLTTLQAPGTTSVPMHMLRVDPAGNISKRFSASSLRIPRYGSACPRWICHHAFMTPGVIRSQIEQMPDGSRFFTLARTVSKPASGWNEPQSHFVVSIGCELGEARRLVYADGLAVDRPPAPIPVGVACRLCERTDCAQRAAPAPRLPSAKSEEAAAGAK